MGCFSDLFQDPKVKRILEKLKTEATKTVEKCVTERLKIEAEKALKISERHSDFATMFNEKKEITEGKIKQYNKEEFSLDKRLVENQVTKVEDLLQLGLTLADELKKESLDELEKKLSGAPAMAQAALKKKITQMTSYSKSQFLHSTFGKPLLKALESYGVDAEALQNYAKELAAAAAKRRAEERTEFNISKNEFDDDYSQAKLLALVEKICKELNPPENSE